MGNIVARFKTALLCAITAALSNERNRDQQLLIWRPKSTTQVD